MSAILKLTDPRVDRSLRSTLIAGALAAGIWTGIVAYQTSAARADVSSKSAQLEAKKSQLDTQDITFRARRRVSASVGEVPAEIAYKGTSAFAYAVDQLVHNAGGSVLGIKFGIKSGDDGNAQGSTNTFECTVTGSFPTMVRVVDGFAASTSTVTVNSADLTRGQVDPKTGACVIQMRIQGKLDP